MRINILSERAKNGITDFFEYFGDYNTITYYICRAFSFIHCLKFVGNCFFVGFGSWYDFDGHLKKKHKNLFTLERLG